MSKLIQGIAISDKRLAGVAKLNPSTLPLNPNSTERRI